MWSDPKPLSAALSGEHEDAKQLDVNSVLANILEAMATLDDEIKIRGELSRWKR